MLLRRDRDIHYCLQGLKCSQSKARYWILPCVPQLLHPDNEPSVNNRIGTLLSSGTSLKVLCRSMDPLNGSELSLTWFQSPNGFGGFELREGIYTKVSRRSRIGNQDMITSLETHNRVGEHVLKVKL